MTIDWEQDTTEYLAELRVGLTDARGTDFYLLEQNLPEDVREVRDRVRAFVDEQVLPVINGYWERAEFPYELLDGLAATGVVGAPISGYGCPGLSRLAQGVAIQELSRGDGSINTFLGVQANLAMGTINMLGSEEQKQRWLPAMAQLSKIGCFALTEPRHGSDSVNLETTARRDGDDWVINGAKRWIGNGPMSDINIIFARDDSDGNVKAFVMDRENPRDPDSRPEGFTYEVITGKAGKRAILQANMFFDDVRVPESNRLPGCESFRDVSRVLATTRGGASWEALGHAIACFEAATSYASSREQFGRPIGATQLVQNTLAAMAADVTSIQLMCHRMAELQQSGQWTGTMASIAKMHTADRAREVARQARDLLAGNGLLLDFHVVRHMTDMEVVHTYEGTEFIQSLLIGRKITTHNAMTEA